MSGPKTIAIAGAGLIGRMLALLLVERGHHVTLFDRDPIESGRAAAWTGAGMLAPWAELESADRGVFELGVRSLGLWPTMADRLGREAIDYQEGGSLLVAHGGDRAEYRRCFGQLTSRLGDDQHDSLRTLDRDGLRQLEPDLAGNFNEGLWLPGEAWVDGQRLMTRLAEVLVSKGVVWHSDTVVQSVESETVVTAGENWHFDTVVDSRGIGGGQSFADLRGVRGELLWLDAPEVRLTRPVRLMHPRYRLYMVPRRDGRYVLGATQIESDDAGPVTVRSALELLSAAYSLHPGFAEARVVHTDANLRPALDDNLPRIVLGEGVVRINGLFRHGFLLAPLVVQEAVDCIEGKFEGTSSKGDDGFSGHYVPTVRAEESPAFKAQSARGAGFSPDAKILAGGILP